MRWISTAERMPADEEEVLILDDYGDIHQVAFNIPGWGPGQWFDGDERRLGSSDAGSGSRSHRICRSVVRWVTQADSRERPALISRAHTMRFYFSRPSRFFPPRATPLIQSN